LDEDAAAHLRVLASDFDQMADWEAEKLEQHVRDYVDATDPAVKLGKVAQPLRAALSGTTVSPPIFDVMVILGKQETLARINDAILATNF
jgi:glutamyl-tRNA synthetase